MLPAMVREIAFNRLPSFMYNTRPRYSPTLLGVVTEKDTPDKTALQAVKKLIGCMRRTTSIHFTDSIDQLAIMPINIAGNTHHKLLCKD